MKLTLGQWQSGASQVLVVGKDNSISIKTMDPNPGTAPHVEVQKWPPTVNVDWEDEEDSSSEDNWQNQELLRQKVEDDTWSIDLSKTQEQNGASILDMWHRQHQQQQQLQQHQQQLQQQQQNV